MGIKPSELNKLHTAFANVKAQVLDACSETISEICEDVYKYADARVPVDTGNLQRSLRVNPPSYNIALGANSVYGEVHFGEPGHVGGWYNTEARTYMWYPGIQEENWHGAILYDGWNKNKNRLVSDLIENIKSQFV